MVKTDIYSRISYKINGGTWDLIYSKYIVPRGKETVVMTPTVMNADLNDHRSSTQCTKATIFQSSKDIVKDKLISQLLTFNLTKPLLKRSDKE